MASASVSTVIRSPHQPSWNLKIYAIWLIQKSSIVILVRMFCVYIDASGNGLPLWSQIEHLCDPCSEGLLSSVCGRRL